MPANIFEPTANGYAGRVRLFGIDEAITLVETEPSDADNAPNWRIHRGDGGEGPEIGAGWNETGERAGDYVSLRIDDPAFAQPIRAALFQNTGDKSTWSLRWSRQPKSREQD